jgi:hypothetical protein
MKNQIVLCVAALMVLVLAQSCAPVFSEMQTARLAGEKQVELTPFFTSTSTGNKSEGIDNESVQTHLGLQVAYGVSPVVDFRFRFESVSANVAEQGDDIGVIGFGPKFSLIKDRLALSTIFGTPLGKGISNSWQFQPSLIGTLPVIKDKIDFTVAPKAVISICDDCENYFAVNTGLSFSSNLNKWALRTEYGRLFYGEDEGRASHFSVGFTVNLGRL